MTGGFAQTARDILRQSEKRLGRQERRPSRTALPESLGAGLASQAVQVMDWNTVDTTTNGFYFSAPGSQNSPDSALSWTGQAIARSDGTGMQQVWNTDGAIPRHYVRMYAPDTPTPAVPVTTAYLGAPTYENAPDAGAIGTGELDDSSDSTGVYANTDRTGGVDSIGAVRLPIPASTIEDPILHLRVRVNVPTGGEVQNGLQLEVRDSDDFIIHEDTIVPDALNTIQNFDIDLDVVPELLDGTKDLRLLRGPMDEEVDGTYTLDVFEAWFTGESTQQVGTGGVLVYGEWQRFATESGYVGEPDLDPVVNDKIDDAYTNALAALENFEPTDPPPSSPTLETMGTVDAITLEVIGPVDQTTHLTYQISHDYDSISETGTWSDLPNQPTRVTMLVTTHDENGDRLVNGVDYWFRVIAGNIIDDALPGEPVSGRLDPTKVTERVEAILKAGNLTVGRLDFGEGDDAPFWDPDVGISVPQADGQTTLISSDPAVPSNWAGKVLATFVTMLGGILQGILEVLGTVRLMKGVSKPKSAPDVIATWDSLVLDTVLAEPTMFYGLCDSVDGTQWVTIDMDLQATVFYDKVTGEETPGWPLNRASGSITRIGSYYYFSQYSSGEFWIQRYDSTGTMVDGFWADVLVFDVANGVPKLGTDGTNILITWPVGGNDVKVRRFSPATYATVSTNTYPNGSNDDLGGVARGEFDFGAGNERIIVARQSGADPRAFRTDTTRDSTREFPRANGNAVRGIWWDGTRFYTLNGTGRIYSYATNPQSEARNIAYEWVSEDGSKRTEIGPTFAYTRPARTKVNITVPPPPESGQTGANKANRVGIQAGLAAGSLTQQTVLAVGVNTVDLATFTTGGSAPAGSNGFAGVSAVGLIESEAFATIASVDTPHTQIKGDGTVRMAKYMQRGVTDSGTISADTNKDVSVTFAVPFDTTPVVTISVTGQNNPSNCFVGVKDVSTTGFTIVFRRSTTTAFSAAWTAGP